jgi:iron complex outermembrane receptor protein
VRTPARSERGLRYFVSPPPTTPTLPLPYLIQAVGNPDFGSEELLAYELGYRVQLSPRLSLDGTVFYHDYDRLWASTVLPAQIQVSPSGAPYVLIPAAPRNDLFGETYGVELSAVWQPLKAWRMQAAYSLLKMNLHTRGAVRSFGEDEETSSPQQQVSLRSEVDLGRHVEWGLGVRYVDPLPALRIPSYIELDARLAWKPSRSCELALIGRNLLDPHHPEAVPSGISVGSVEVDRAVYGKITWRF